MFYLKCKFIKLKSTTHNIISQAFRRKIGELYIYANKYVYRCQDHLQNFSKSLLCFCILPNFFGRSLEKKLKPNLSRLRTCINAKQSFRSHLFNRPLLLLAHSLTRSRKMFDQPGGGSFICFQMRNHLYIRPLTPLLHSLPHTQRPSHLLHTPTSAGVQQIVQNSNISQNKTTRNMTDVVRLHVVFDVTDVDKFLAATDELVSKTQVSKS